MSWSPRAIEKLEQLYAENLTYSEIAVGLADLRPGTTREAVGGKIKRLDLKTRSGKERYAKPSSPRNIPRYLIAPVTLPHAHPLTRALFAEAARQGVSQRILSRRSGIHRKSFSQWKGGAFNPSLLNLEACFNALGLTLQPVPLEVQPKRKRP